MMEFLVECDVHPESFKRFRFVLLGFFLDASRLLKGNEVSGVSHPLVRLLCVLGRLICHGDSNRSVSNNGDEDDEMNGAIDLNDVDWASSDMEIVGNDDVDIAPAPIPLAFSLSSSLKPLKNNVRSNSGEDGGMLDTSNNGTPGMVSSSIIEDLSPRSVNSSSPTNNTPANSAPTNSVPTTRASSSQRTSPFNLKACSACKKGKAQAIKCRVDRRHWEDPDWTDPPTRPWVMPEGFVEWLATEERQAQKLPGDAKFVLRGVADAAAKKMASNMAASSAAALSAAGKAKGRPPNGGSSSSSAVSPPLTSVAASAPEPRAKPSSWSRTSGPKHPPGTKQIIVPKQSIGSKQIAEAKQNAGEKQTVRTKQAVGAKQAVGTKQIMTSKSVTTGMMVKPVIAGPFSKIDTASPAMKGGMSTLTGKAGGRHQDAGRNAGPRLSQAETASSLLERMLGTASLPSAPAPQPAARPIIPASMIAPGAPVAGGLGIKRPRCLAEGCLNPVTNNAPFCSADCTVAAQKQAVRALIAFFRRTRQPARVASASASGTARNTEPGKVDNGTLSKSSSSASVRSGGSGGGDAALGGEGGGGAGVKSENTGGGGGKQGGGAGAAAGAEATAGGGGGQASFAARAPWTAEEEEEFSKGLDTVRDSAALTKAQKFRIKIRDRFRELFAEGMAALGVDAEDMMMAGVLAWDLEHELHVFSGADRNVYKEKGTSLRFNITFAKNPELFKVGCSALYWGGPCLRVLWQHP